MHMRSLVFTLGCSLMLVAGPLDAAESGCEFTVRKECGQLITGPDSAFSFKLQNPNQEILWRAQYLVNCASAPCGSCQFRLSTVSANDAGDQISTSDGQLGGTKVLTGSHDRYFIPVKNSNMTGGIFSVVFDRDARLDFEPQWPTFATSQALNTESRPLDVEISWPASCPLTINRISSSDDRFDVRIWPREVSPGGSASFSVVFKPDHLKPGETPGTPIDASINVKGQTAPDLVAEATIPITGTTPIDFGHVLAGGQAETKFSLTAPTTKAMGVTVTSSDPKLTVDRAIRQIGAGATEELNVMLLAPMSPLGSYTQTLRIERMLGNDPLPTLFVTVTAFIDAARLRCGGLKEIPVPVNDGRFVCFKAVLANDGTISANLLTPVGAISPFKVVSDSPVSAPTEAFALADGVNCKDPINAQPIQPDSPRTIPMAFFAPLGLRGVYRGRLIVHSDAENPILECPLELLVEASPPKPRIDRGSSGIQGHYFDISPFGSENDSYGFGAFFSYRLTPRDTLLIFLDTALSVFPADSAGEAEEVLAGEKTQLLAGLRVGIQRERFGLYAKARPGLIRFSDVADDERSRRATTRAALDLGIVLDLPVGDRLFIRVDAGDTIISLPRTSQDSEGERGGSRIDHNLQVAVGAGFRF